MNKAELEIYLEAVNILDEQLDQGLVNEDDWELMKNAIARLTLTNEEAVNILKNFTANNKDWDKE